jgi:hypothetical protein
MIVLTLRKRRTTMRKHSSLVLPSGHVNRTQAAIHLGFTKRVSSFQFLSFEWPGDDTRRPFAITEPALAASSAMFETEN